MRYTVFVMLTGGNTRFDLTKTTDGHAAAELVGILVGAASGVSLEVGVEISQDTEPAPTTSAATRREVRQPGAVGRQPQ